MSYISPFAILPKKSALFTIIGITFFVSILVYGSSLSFDFVRWDDGMLIYENPAIRGITLSNLRTIFTTYDPELYIPLTLLSYQIDYLIGGIHPAIYHFHNIVLHTLNALLVMWVLGVLGCRRWIAVFLGMVFALHPLNTEAVLWASARKDVLSCFFFLLSLLGYCAYKSHQKKLWYYTSIFLFALGLLSKVTILGLPFILLIIDWHKSQNINAKIVIEKVPYFALSIAFAVIAFFGKTAVLGGSSLNEKFLIPLKSVTFYLQKFLFPTKLSVLYPITSDVSVGNSTFLIPMVIVTVLAILIIGSLKKTRVVFFGFAWFALCVGPTVFNFSKGDFLYYASDRYAYSGMIGLLFIVGYFLPYIRKREWVYGGCGVVVIAFAILSSIQSSTWRNSETLFTHAVLHYPNAAVAHNNLGNVLSAQSSKEGALMQAISHYEKALDISEYYGRTIGDTSPGHSKILSNIASAYRQQGEMNRARDTYKEALRLNPVNAFALLGLGILHGQIGDVATAESYYRSAIDTLPVFVAPYVNLGSLLVQTGRFDEAISVLENGIDQNPFYPQAHYNVSIALKKAGRHREALEHLEQAVDLEPRFTAARINLGITYAERKKTEEAIEQFQAILQYDPGNARARSALHQLGI